MKKMNLTLKLVAILGLAFGLSACGSKSSSRKANINQQRINGTYAPGTQNVNTTYTQYGKVYNNQQDMSESVRSFLGLQSGDSQVGFISGSPSSNQTGIVLDGYVSNSGSGTLKIYIWDSIAISTNQVIAVQLNFQGAQQNGGYQYTFADEFGSVSLSGNVSGGVFQGTFYFNNNDGNNGQLGQFQINANTFFR